MEENAVLETQVETEKAVDVVVEPVVEDKTELPKEEPVVSTKTDKKQKSNKIDFNALDDETKKSFVDNLDSDTLLSALQSKRKSLSPEQSEQLANSILDKHKTEHFNGKENDYQELVKNAPNFYLEQKAFYDKHLDNAGIEQENRFDKDGNLTKIALASIVPQLAFHQTIIKQFSGDKIPLNNGNISNYESNVVYVDKNFYQQPIEQINNFIKTNAGKVLKIKS
jgi:hypothetical protein